MSLVEVRYDEIDVVWVCCRPCDQDKAKQLPADASFDAARSRQSFAHGPCPCCVADNAPLHYTVFHKPVVVVHFGSER